MFARKYLFAFAALFCFTGSNVLCMEDVQQFLDQFVQKAKLVNIFTGTISDRDWNELESVIKEDSLTTLQNIENTLEYFLCDMKEELPKKYNKANIKRLYGIVHSAANKKRPFLRPFLKLNIWGKVTVGTGAVFALYGFGCMLKKLFGSNKCHEHKHNACHAH